MLVAPPGRPAPPTGNDKTSLVAVVGDRTGALLELLSEFAVRGISLTRIESRPTRERLGVYSFSLDCEGHIADRRVGEALAALHRVCDDVRFLGSYPRADGRREQARAAGRPATRRSPRPRPGWRRSAPALELIIACGRSHGMFARSADNR